MRAIALSLEEEEKEEERFSIQGELFKNKMTDSNQTIALVFIADSETVAGMDDDDEEEILKRAIAMSLEEQQ